MEAGLVLDGRYELRARIGEGASSTVGEAIDCSSNDHVAVKIVSLDEAGWRQRVELARERRLDRRRQRRHRARVRRHDEVGPVPRVEIGNQ